MDSQIESTFLPISYPIPASFLILPLFMADIETIMNSEVNSDSPLLQIFGDFLHQRPLPMLKSEYPILLHKFGDAKIKGTGLSKLEGNCEFWKDLTNPKPPNPKSQPP
jgi:hypothetical protein